jgi:hypothetical protein
MSSDGRLEPSFDAGIAGPLQGKVNSPDFTDWQNIDWSALGSPAAEMISSPGGFMTSPVEGNNGLFEPGNGFVSSLRTTLGCITQCLLMAADAWRSRSSPTTVYSTYDSVGITIDSASVLSSSRFFVEKFPS